MVRSNANDHHERPQKASEWASLLQQELLLIATYEDVTQVPSTIFINESILEAPRRRAADPAAAQLAKQISHIMYPSHDPDSEYPIIQYEKDLIRLRKLVSTQRKRTIDDNTKRNELLTWVHRIAKQGAWDPATDPVSLNGAPSLPMPVEIAEAATLTPFFQHLALGGDAAKTSTVHGSTAVDIEAMDHHTQALEFEKGVLYADRRMDLCKMVLGPNNIATLMESLKTNDFVTHFLLGNNIIGPHGAKCIADFMKEFPNRMDTWYLAGNCIDAYGFRLLVDEWVQSTSVTNIWLKRNPLGSTAADDVFRLITQTPNLRTLDLDQTELGDIGVAKLFTALETYDKPHTIRNVYMNALGVGVNGAAAIAKYLASPHCALERVYLTNNPMGNDGVIALAAGLKKNKSLSRLTLASVGVSDDGIIALCDALEKHPNLITLDVGQSYATEDLDARYNWLTDRSAFAIHNFVACSPKLAYFNIAYCAMTHLGLSTILDAIVSSPTLMFYRASSIWPQSRVAAAVRAGQQHIKLSKQAHATLLKNVQATYGDETTYDNFMNDHKRWLTNDKTDVRKIDSVYRNRDAGLARRGLKKLDKWWDEGDETLKEVMGAVGPVCTKRK
jgi:Ran GTPase-activating protein (RanGAP) involved in mRNA processing and transport